MARKRDGMEVRGIPSNTAFLGTIDGAHGLWWRDASGVFALDVRDTTGKQRVTFLHRPRKEYTFHYVGEGSVIDNYEGPLDIQIRVKGFSPWRGKGQPAPSHVEVVYQKEHDLRKGPRKVRLRDEDHDAS